MSAQSYFYRGIAGQEIGPFDANTLAKLRSGGALDGDTPVRAADSTEWKPCREIVAESQAPPVVAAPPPASAPGTRGVNRRTPLLVVAGLLVIAIAGILVYKLDNPVESETQHKYEGVQEDLIRKVNEDIAVLRGRPTSKKPGAPQSVPSSSFATERAITPSEARKRQWKLEELKTLLGGKSKDEVKKLLGPPDSTAAGLGEIYVYNRMKVRNPDTEKNDNTLLVEFDGNPFKDTHPVSRVATGQ